MRPQVGQLVNNKYRLSKMLGDGGMGSVFEAQHEILGKAVALKFLHPELARRQGLVQRFLQEARVSSVIDSRHVVKVTDVEQTPTGLPFMVMEFLKGKSLQALYEENYRAGRRLTYDEALKYAVQILDGLEAAHEEGVVHRDLKPDNVMIVQGKRNESIVKLLDFGIAKLKINGELYKGLTRPGVIMGTPEYMAPEQVFSADAVDGRADIFSCGVMIFEMLAGRRPVGGDEAHQIAAAYLSGNIAKLSELAPHIPRGLADVIHKAMAADPKDRYANVCDFRAAMEPYTSDVSRPAYTTTPPVVSSDSEPRAPLASDPRISNPESSAAAADAASSNPSSGGKSPDGWAVDGAGPRYDGAATDKVSQPFIGEDYAAISAKLKAAGLNGPSPNVVQQPFESTVEAQPFFPGSTAAYQPPSNPPPAAETDSQRRPGGTDVGEGAVPETAEYDPMSSVYAGSATPNQPYVQRRRRRSGMGFGSILLLGTVIAGAVVGGVYAFDHVGKSKPKEETPAKTFALPSPKTVETPPVTQQSVVTVPVQQPVSNPFPTTPVTTPSQKPTGPKPGPGPKPSTSNTSSPPIIPSVIPGLPFPPFDFPLPGMGGGDTQKKDPPPAQSSDPQPKQKPGRPKLEPIPSQLDKRRGGLERIPELPSKETKPQKPAEKDDDKQASTIFRLPKIFTDGVQAPKPAARTETKPRSEQSLSRTRPEPRRRSDSNG